MWVFCRLSPHILTVNHRTGQILRRWKAVAVPARTACLTEGDAGFDDTKFQIKGNEIQKVEPHKAKWLARKWHKVKWYKVTWHKAKWHKSIAILSNVTQSKVTQSDVIQSDVTQSKVTKSEETQSKVTHTETAQGEVTQSDVTQDLKFCVSDTLHKYSYDLDQCGKSKFIAVSCSASQACLQVPCRTSLPWRIALIFISTFNQT